jgi:hypothetical protein
MVLLKLSFAHFIERKDNTEIININASNEKAITLYTIPVFISVKDLPVNTEHSNNLNYIANY